LALSATSSRSARAEPSRHLGERAVGLSKNPRQIDDDRKFCGRVVRHGAFLDGLHGAPRWLVVGDDKKQELLAAGLLPGPAGLTRSRSRCSVADAPRSSKFLPAGDYLAIVDEFDW